MDKKAMIHAINQIAKERGIEPNVIFGKLEEALFAAYMQIEGTPYPARVRVTERGDVFLEEYTGDEEYVTFEEAPASQVLVSEIDFEQGEIGRMAAASVKNTLTNFLQNSQAEEIESYYRERIGEGITGRIESSDSRSTLVSLPYGGEGIVLRDDRHDHERLRKGRRQIFHIKDVRLNRGTPEVLLSRTSAELIDAVLAEHVPEVEQGLIRIEGVARQPGVRSIVVFENSEQVAVIPTLRGMGNQRMRAIMGELGEERVHFVVRRDSESDTLTHMFPGVHVRAIEWNDDESAATILITPKDQELANEILPLAQDLVPYHIELAVDKSASSQKRQRPVADHVRQQLCEYHYENGKQCPNHHLEGEKYCSVHKGIS